MDKQIEKKHIVLIVLSISVFIAFMVLKWASEETPVYRPLLQDMRLVDSVKIADVLDQQKIHYYADIKNQMLYVNQRQTEQARVSLAKIGIVINYPKVTVHSDLNKAYDEFIQQQQAQDKQEIWKTAWFERVIKMMTGAIIVIVMILAVIRPALKRLLDEENEM